MIPCATKNSIPFTKSESVIIPSAHHPAEFLIQEGISSPNTLGTEKIIINPKIIPKYTYAQFCLWT